MVAKPCDFGGHQGGLRAAARHTALIRATDNPLRVAKWRSTRREPDPSTKRAQTTTRLFGMEALHGMVHGMTWKAGWFVQSVQKMRTHK